MHSRTPRFSWTLLALGPALAGCGMEGSGVFETRSFELPPFDAVEIGYGADLEVKTGSVASTLITLDDNLFDALQVEVEDRVLRIGFDSGRSYTNYRLVAVVETPALRGVELSGGSTGWAQLDDASRLHLELSGASLLRFEAGEVDHVSMSLSGGSRVEMDRGVASRLTLEGSGGSSVQALEATLQNAEVDLSGGSEAELVVEQRVRLPLGRLSARPARAARFGARRPLGRLDGRDGARPLSVVFQPERDSTARELAADAADKRSHTTKPAGLQNYAPALQ